MRIRYAQIECIRQYIRPTPDPTIINGMITIAAVGITDDDRMVRFLVNTSPILTAFIDGMSEALAGSDQLHVLEELNFETWPGKTKP